MSGKDADGPKTLTAIFTIVRSTDLMPSEKVLWLLVRSFDSGNGCWASTERFAGHMGLSERQVERIRAELIRRGYLSRQLRGPRPALYRAIVPPTTDMDAYASESLRADVGGKVEAPTQAPTQGPTPMSPEYGYEYGLEYERESSLSLSGEGKSFPTLVSLPRGGLRRQYPPEFNGAFAALPRRHRPHAKSGAYKAWRARTSEVAEVFQLEVAALHYCDEQDAAGKTGTQFVKQATTFFGPDGHVETYLGIDVPHEWPTGKKKYTDAARAADGIAEGGEEPGRP